MSDVPIYEAVLSKLRRDLLQTDKTYLSKVRKHNKHRKALREVADEHFGPEQVDRRTAT